MKALFKELYRQYRIAYNPDMCYVYGEYRYELENTLAHCHVYGVTFDMLSDSIFESLSKYFGISLF